MRGMTIASTAVQTTGSTGSGTTGPFSFSFRVQAYGANTVAAQLEVVKVTIATGAEATLTYPTDFSVSVNNDQDSSPGGSVTLTVALTSAYKLYIRRAPVFTQETDLTPQGPYNAQTVETQFDQVAMQVLELRARQMRSPHVGIQASSSFDGEISGPITAGYIPQINDAGTGFELVANNGSSSLVTVTGSTTARTLADRLRDIGVTPLDFGATGDGVADDTDAIDAANTYAEANSLPLYFPPDYTFTYDGDGLTGSHMVLTGAGMSESIIVIGAGKYLIDDTGAWGSLLVRNLRTVGGAGVIRNRYTSANVQLAFTVRDCYFRDYTGPAISTNSSDFPYWTIENNIFWGANSTACVGVALKGLSDNTWICNNRFKKNKVHIKLAEGGNNVQVVANELLRYGAGTARVDIQIVPDVDGSNAGTGLYIGPQKFGNENIDSSDFRIVYADELSGTYFGDKLPDMSTNSTGYINGHRIECAVYGTGGTPNIPLVKSMTKNVLGCRIGPIAIGGTPPSYLIEFSQAPDSLTASAVTWNIVGPVHCDGADDLTGFAMASHYNSIKLLDPIESAAPQTQSIAAASTTDISAAYAQSIIITGSGQTISALGTAPAGVRRRGRFAGANTLVHNGTSLILPKAANITTAANDTWEAVSLGSGNWLFAYYKTQGQNIATEYVHFCSTATLDAGVTAYIGINGVQSAEANTYIAMARAGTISRVYLAASAAPGAGESIAITVRKAGSDTSMVGSIGGAATYTADITSNPVSVTAEDIVTIRVTASGSAASANLRGFIVIE